MRSKNLVLLTSTEQGLMNVGEGGKEKEGRDWTGPNPGRSDSRALILIPASLTVA